MTTILFEKLKAIDTTDIRAGAPPLPISTTVVNPGEKPASCCLMPANEKSCDNNA